MSTLHRRTPSSESYDSVTGNPNGAPPKATARAGKKPQKMTVESRGTHGAINTDHDVEMNTGGKGQKSKQSPKPLKSKHSGIGESLEPSSTKSSVASASVAISACALYSFCSVSMILTNKSLASSYNHLIDGDLNILLVVFQSITAVVCVEVSKRMGWIEPYPNLTYDVAKAWAPVNLFFCGMLFTGMASLQTNSVPMVTVFKNVTNVITTFGDLVFFGNKPETLVLAAFGVMLFGAVAAAKNDISITATGLFWMFANCASTAGYVLYMKHATNTVKMSKFGMVFVNNVLCTAFLVPAAFVFGDIKVFVLSEDIHTIDYYLKNFFAGFIGFFLNFASLNCVQATGPATYAIVGSLSKVPVAFLGYILFDSAITFETWCYIGVSMCGGFLYSYAKLQTSRANHGHRK